MKELEDRCAALETYQIEVSAENELLKQRLERLSTENKTLRYICVANGSRNSDGDYCRDSSGYQGVNNVKCAFTHHAALGLQSSIINQPAELPLQGRLMSGNNSQRLLTPQTAWDYIASHELFKSGLLDTKFLNERLAEAAIRDEKGIAFHQAELLSIIEGCGTSESDNLF